MKKILSALLFLGLFCGNAAADGGNCGDGVSWDFNNNTLTISYMGSGTGAMTDGATPWSSHKGEIKAIVIGEGVTHIGDSAFYSYTQPTRVIISDTVTSIGASAFYGCWGINSLTMGKKVKTIGAQAFLNCSGFRTLILPDTLTHIGQKAFYQCFDLETLTFMVPKKNNQHDLEIGSEAFGDKRKAAKIAYSSEKGILKEKNTGKEVTEGASIEEALSGKLLTWAEHTPSNYLVTFDPNDGGMLKAGITTQRIPVNSSAPLFTKAKLDLQNVNADLVFTGWATAKDAKKAEYTDGSPYAPTDDVTLYAVWKSNECIITFDANGGTFTSDELTITTKSGVTVMLTTAQTLGLSHEDQELFFTGWSRTQNGTVNFVDGADCTPEKDMTLYAVWRKNGDGSEGDPFLIDNWSRLKKLAAEVNGGNFYTNTHFRLTAELRNIDEDWTPIGQSYSRSFNGIFNGDGHRVTYKISNSTDTYQGLFGCLDTGGTIKKLFVYGTISGGGMYCGGIAGWVSTSCAIKNCSSLVTLSSPAGKSLVNLSSPAGEKFLGGIAGCNTGVTEYCTAQGNITNGGNENIHVGGIAGLNQSGTVSRCSGLVWVGSTRNYVGMVVGDNKEDTYAVGTVVDCNYLADMANGHKGVGNGNGGTDTGTGSLSLDEMKAYTSGLGDEFAVCREGILSGLSYGGDDGLGEAGERNSSSNGCNAGPGGVCGAMLALLVIRKEKRS